LQRKSTWGKRKRLGPGKNRRCFFAKKKRQRKKSLSF
jgi:hypothetical protein